MKRRHFLKLAAALPFIGPLIAKSPAPAFPGAKPSTEPYLRALGLLPSRRGQLTVVVGPPKFGKTSFAQSANRHMGDRYHVLDNVESLTDPAADCAYLTMQGVNVLAIVRSNKNATLLIGYGAGPEIVRHKSSPSISTMLYRADRIILISGFSLRIQSPAEEKKFVDLTWHCKSLKDQYKRAGKTWEWNDTIPFARAAPFGETIPYA